jgi:hypothetical protein
MGVQLGSTLGKKKIQARYKNNHVQGTNKAYLYFKGILMDPRVAFDVKVLACRLPSGPVPATIGKSAG